MNDSPRKLARLCLLSVGLTVLAIVISLWASPQPDLAGKYMGFCGWDCRWYQSIADQGYHSPVPPVAQNPDISNVAFFPGYPIPARIIKTVLGLDQARIPLLLIAQAFCCVFWFALLLLFDRWKLRMSYRVFFVVALFVHPAAFYLVMGYSESMFMASMLLYMYWSEDERPSRQRMAAAAGFVMSATRIVGLPLAAYPLLRWGLDRKVFSQFKTTNWKSALRPAALSLAAASGCLLFLTYCWFEFGDFQFYMLTQKIGWGIVPDYGALWKWEQFRYISNYERVSTIASGLGLLALILTEALYAFRRSLPGKSVRIALILCGALIFYITLSGLKCLSFRSMIRYTLPWCVLAELYLAKLIVEAPELPEPRPQGEVDPIRLAIALCLGGLLVLGYVGEFQFLKHFLYGQWFA